MFNELSSINLKVGLSIKHFRCPLRKTIVYVGCDYILCEYKNIPTVVYENEYDNWNIVPKVFEELDSIIIKRAYENSSNVDTFFNKIEEYLKDFKESSLP